MSTGRHLQEDGRTRAVLRVLLDAYRRDLGAVVAETPVPPPRPGDPPGVPGPRDPKLPSEPEPRPLPDPLPDPEPVPSPVPTMQFDEQLRAFAESRGAPTGAWRAEVPRPGD